MTTIALPSFRHAGARALVSLHEQHMRSCVAVWLQAESTGVTTPAVNDTDYESMGALGAHVLGCARHYLVWICEQLEVALPTIDRAPAPADLAVNAQRYLEYVLEHWRQPLAAIEPDQFEGQVYTSAWGEPFTIDSMLEHAVMHPIRHEFQLRAWMARA